MLECRYTSSKKDLPILTTEMYIEEGKKYYHGNLWIQD